MNGELLSWTQVLLTLFGRCLTQKKNNKPYQYEWNLPVVSLSRSNRIVVELCWQQGMIRMLRQPRLSYRWERWCRNSVVNCNGHVMEDSECIIRSSGN